MDETTYVQTIPRTVAEHKAAMEAMLAEMNRLNQKMEGDRREIERLKAESDVLKTETRTILAAMGATF